MRGQRITAISNETLPAAEVLLISMLQATCDRRPISKPNPPNSFSA
jgi:hypothetical protein